MTDDAGFETLRLLPMWVEPEFLFAAAVAAIAFLVGVYYLRSRARRTRVVGRRVAGGPSNQRFNCAGCGNQFSHSRRTLAGWERGTRKFFCHACHTKARGAQQMAPQGSRVMTRSPGGKNPRLAPVADGPSAGPRPDNPRRKGKGPN